MTTTENEAERLREMLWLRHGCSFGALYGDDGEMQCSACGIDFRRDTMVMIRERFNQRTVDASRVAGEPAARTDDDIAEALRDRAVWLRMRSDDATADLLHRAADRLATRPSGAGAKDIRSAWCDFLMEYRWPSEIGGPALSADSWEALDCVVSDFVESLRGGGFSLGQDWVSRVTASDALDVSVIGTGAEAIVVTDAVRLDAAILAYYKHTPLADPDPEHVVRAWMPAVIAAAGTETKP